METKESRGDAESRSRTLIASRFAEANVGALGAPVSSPASRPVSKLTAISAPPRLRVPNLSNAPEIVAIARTWIGTPYVHQASVRGVGCDCLGLLRGVWRELRGAEPEDAPPYSPDWAEATGVETMYLALKRHLTEVAPGDIAPGDIALFRMTPRGPAKHCGIVAEQNGVTTLIHARQNKRVSEEPLSPFWWQKLVFAFRLP